VLTGDPALKLQEATALPIKSIFCC